MTVDEFKNLTSTCWNDNFQPLTIDMTKDNFLGFYRMKINVIFIHDSSPF